MTAPADYLIDTNILLRLSHTPDPRRELIRAAMIELDRGGARLFFTLQTISEFWNVCTRPPERNGFGLSIMETERRVVAIEAAMTLLADTGETYVKWRELVRAKAVRGVQVHDARLAAIMEVHGVQNILTFNGSDFARFADVKAVHPSEIVVAG
jgi:predicted nucleic acid-binding protein